MIPFPSLATTTTLTASLLSALVVVQLAMTSEYDSAPPVLIATCTATALAWIWRMQLARTQAELRADEAMIRRLREINAADLARQREEAAFREISRYLSENEN